VNVFADMWAYLADPDSWTGSGSGGILQLLVQQLLLTGTALLLAVLVGLPLALWLGHLGRGGFWAINVSNIGRAVPTFALLAILVAADWPGTDTLGPYGRAGLATLIALTLFALPPIITNAYVAVDEVGADVKESAKGMGMTSAQQFWRVELPLARPLVLGGVRLALVQVWATATIAALVAGPGLGRIITDGFYRSFYGQGLAGAVVVAVVALVLELGAAAVQRAADPVPHGPRAGGTSTTGDHDATSTTDSTTSSSQDRTRVADGRGTQKV
jgi:osmoprotectant transport system permease protein